jgi:hypothetical protein
VYEIRILDTALVWVDVAEDFKSLRWKRRWQAAGEFHMVINRFSKSAQHLVKGRILHIRRNGAHEAAGIIRRIARSIDEGGRVTDDLEVTGNTLDGLLARRICLPPAGVAYDERTGAAETVMKGFVDANLVNPTDPARKMPGFVIAADQARGAAITERMRYNPLPEALLLCALAGGNLGWEVTLANSQYVFDVLQGVDRSSTQNLVPPIIFSPDFDNIRMMSYENSDIGLANVGYVAGQGEGAARSTVLVPETKVTKAETTQADFQTGTLVDTVATAAGDLEMGPWKENWQGYASGTAPNWFAVVGAWAVQTYGGTQALRSDANSNTPGYAIHPEQFPNVRTVKMRINDVSPDGANSPHPGAVVAYQDAQNYDTVYFRAGSDELVWWQWRAGAATAVVIANLAISEDVWHTLEVRLDDVGGAVVLIDGAQVYSAATGWLTGTSRIGFWSHGTGEAYYDDVEVPTHRENKKAGTRTAPAVDLTPAGTAVQSIITWNATTPANTTLVVDTSLDGGANWSPANNGAAIPGITTGMDLKGKSLLVRVTETTTDTTVTPQLHDITVDVTGISDARGVGITRLETFIDARDLATTDQLKQRGQAKLAGNNVEERLEAEILAIAGFRYRDDWDLGDQVTLRNLEWGVTQHKSIAEVSVTLEDGVDEQIVVTFGAPWKGLLDTIKKEIADTGPSMRI